jgi:hypothetical protein
MFVLEWLELEFNAEQNTLYGFDEHLSSKRPSNNTLDKPKPANIGLSKSPSMQRCFQTMSMAQLCARHSESHANCQV